MFESQGVHHKSPGKRLFFGVISITYSCPNKRFPVSEEGESWQDFLGNGRTEARMRGSCGFTSAATRVAECASAACRSVVRSAMPIGSWAALSQSKIGPPPWSPTSRHMAHSGSSRH